MILLHVVPKDGGEHWSDHYEVLCGTDFTWVSNSDDGFVGGKAGNGEPFYVCSSRFNNAFIPGKLYKPTGCCYIASFGKEHCMNDYLVMKKN